MPSSFHQSNGDGRLEPSGSSGRNRRSTSDVTPAIKAGRKWSFTNGSRRWKGKSNRNEGRFSTINEPSRNDAAISALPSCLSPFVDPVTASDLEQLRKYTLKIRNATKNVNHVDSAWEEYIKHKEKCLEWSKTLVSSSPRKREVFMASPTTRTLPPGSEYQRDLLVDTSNSVATDTDSSTHSSSGRADSPLHIDVREGQCQEAVLEWESTVKHLENTLRASLRDTYNEYNKDATPAGFETICANKDARRATIYRMRNASISKLLSADLDFFPKYDVRFRNYDEIKKDLARVRLLLSTSAIPQDRTIIERWISPTGDTILEFTNMKSREHPVFRFRVASHCLRETSSPIFGHMFNARFRAELDDDTRRGLPSPPIRYVCGDGSEVMLYRMPQTELNIGRSFEILLHAAHNHSDRVPREVSFDHFVAIAEACQRYRCTSPLELAVEHWLPYWREKATDDMLEGALLISYVFGLSKNFTRLSRIAILNSTGARYKPWPRRVQEKIAAARREKMEQICQQCKTTLNEYLYPQPRTNHPSSASRSQEGLTSGLRCPRGEPTCDMQNLGWFMKWLTKAGLLTTAANQPAFLNIQVPQDKSLQEITNALCQTTSPPQNHGGVCDLAATFRAAISDIQGSVAGLTFLEVSGKRGWALSKHRSPRHSTHGPASSQGGVSAGLYEELFEIAARERVAHGDSYRCRLRSVAMRGYGDIGDDDGDDGCFFGILRLLDDPRDLRSAALVSRRFLRSYLRHEEVLWEGMGSVRNGRAGGTDGIPSRALGRGDGLFAGGADRPQDKFRPGELFLGEGNPALEGDENKCLGEARERLLGLNRGERGWRSRGR
ncbi:hypothetical protein F4861DRAFT_267816 [Xylaria intraflava]|nr:hypothetical protein F4861DRAFT_267816 [Xylaria intraflava]